MRLDREGEPATVADLLTRFAGTREWLPAELTFLEDDDEHEESDWSVRLYPGGLSADEPVETADGPFVVIVDGDLATPGFVRFSTGDYVPGLVVVTGDLRAEALWFESGARVVIEGSAFVRRACFGRWGDANAMLGVAGVLDTPLLALDGNTPVGSDGGIRSVIYDGGGWWKDLEPDILSRANRDERYFPPELIAEHGGLDLVKAFAAARAGAPLLLPGVAESFPQRLRPRPARNHG